MGKDSFYFPHDYNARADRKLVKLAMSYGMMGLGIYWCIVEMLYEEGGHLPLEYERISYELREDIAVIQHIINDFDLFKISPDKFWSESALDRLQKRNDKSEKARKSVNSRWHKDVVDTDEIRTNGERNTIKERKGKNIYRGIFKIPTINDISQYCEERKNTINPQVFINHYESNGWMVGKNKMKDWKAAVRTWEEKDRENQHQQKAATW